jgi:acetyl esterase/lipase
MIMFSIFENSDSKRLHILSNWRSHYDNVSMKMLPLLSALFIAISGYSQQGVFRDTSFSIHSAYAKAFEKYPFIEVVTKSESSDNFRQEDDVIYSKQDHNLRLSIIHPKGKSKVYPGILLIHGGGWRSGDLSQMIPLAQALAAKGYVALSVEYRLSPEALYPAALEDLKAAIRWMHLKADKYNLNSDKIAVLGFSAGGQLASLLGTLNEPDNENNVQAVVNIDGILAFKHRESEEGASASGWLGGTYEEKPDVWKDASALTHVNRYSPPVLFINSSIPRFHAGRDDMIHKLDSLHIYSEVKTIPDSPHTFMLFHPWFEPTLQYVAGFLNRVFKQE